MPTQEEIIQRRIKFAKQFAAQGATVPKAVKLSGVAEATAQRRGRGYDPLVNVIETSVPQSDEKAAVYNFFAPPPPPVPKVKPSCRVDEMYDEGSNSCIPRTVPGLGCFQFQPKQSIARGVSYSGCPGRPGYVYASELNEQANLTTERYFGEGIAKNQAALKAAGYKSPPSNSELSRIAFDIGKAQQVMVKSCKAKFTNTPGCRGASERVASLRKRQKDLQTASYGWF